MCTFSTMMTGILICRNRAIKKHFHCLKGDEIERLNDDETQAIAQKFVE
jgi:hypothetical protein